MGWGWGTPRQAARARDFCTLILGGGQTGSSSLLPAGGRGWPSWRGAQHPGTGMAVVQPGCPGWLGAGWGALTRLLRGPGPLGTLPAPPQQSSVPPSPSLCPVLALTSAAGGHPAGLALGKWGRATLLPSRLAQGHPSPGLAPWAHPLPAPLPSWASLPRVGGSPVPPRVTAITITPRPLMFNELCLPINALPPGCPLPEREGTPTRWVTVRVLGAAGGAAPSPATRWDRAPRRARRGAGPCWFQGWGGSG